MHLVTRRNHEWFACEVRVPCMRLLLKLLVDKMNKRILLEKERWAAVLGYIKKNQGKDKSLKRINRWLKNTPEY
jgi:hypothetical protein